MDDKNLLTGGELTFFIIGTILGIGLFQLPYEIVKKVGQDGWIATILGTVYPLYIIAISSYIIKKCPNDNLVVLSKRHFGKFLGSIFSLLYLFEFVTIVSSIVAGFVRILRIYAVGFVPYNNIAIIIIFISIYAVYEGIKNLARMQKLTFYILLVITSVSLGAIKDASILNVMPVLENGIVPCLKATKTTIYPYSGMEVLLLIYPFVKNKKAIYKDAIKSLVICTCFYTWVVFITIYYLGTDIILKSPWPFSLVTESIDFPVISNTRFIFIFLWSIAVFITTADSYYIVSLGLSYITNKDFKNICIFISPIMIYLTTIYKNEIARRKLVQLFMQYGVGFNILYITVLAIFIYMSKSKAAIDNVQN